MIETKFKQTELGVIPEDWTIKTIEEIGDVRTGPFGSALHAKDYVLKGTPIITVEHIGDIYVDKTKPIPQISNDDKERLKEYALKCGDIVFSRVGSVDRNSLITDEENGWLFSGRLLRIRKKNDEGYVPLYLCYHLNSKDAKARILSEAVGLAMPSLNTGILNRIKVALPSNLEQKRIAEALSNIDQLISSLSKTIEKKRLIKQGAMQQLLTGKKRLPGFDGEWTTHKIGDFLSILKGYGLSKSQLVQDGVNKCILYGELFTKYDYEIKTCISRTDSDEGLLSESGDILLPGSTTTNGIDLAKAVSVYENSIHLGGDIVVLRDKKIVEYEPYFVSAKITELCKQAIEQSSQGITIIHLNTCELRKIEVTIPSTRKEQMAIVTVLRTMDNEIESLEEERDKYIRLKEGMMQKLLTGQIRLVEAAKKQEESPKAKTANVYFKRSVLAAEIADRLCEERTFGHVKMEKLIFLTEHLCHIDIDSHYHRDAAGPYDNRALRSIDSQMKKQMWFEAKKEDKGYRYLPMQNRGGHKKYFEKYYADVMPMFEKIIDTFKTSSTEQCEIVATLYSAWDDLLQNHQPFTDDDILNEVLNNWNETKKRIKRSRWQAALDWMRANGFVPQNDNR